MIPKGAKYGNKVFRGKTKEERVKELLADTDINTTFLPSTIGIIDLDTEIINQLNNDRLTTISPSKKSIIPAIMIGNEKWGEFAKTWQYTDDDKNVIFPIISIKKVETKFGSRLGDDRYFISNRKNYEYARVPVMDDQNRLRFDIYKIPNPTPIDITYEIKLFTNFNRDLNAFDELFIRNFQDGQFYISVKGHYMPIYMDSNSDSSVTDINKNQIIVRSYNIKLKGFIHNEDEFELIKSTERVIQITEINNKEVARQIIGVPNGSISEKKNSDENDIEDMNTSLMITPDAGSVLKENTGKVLSFNGGSYNNGIVSFGAGPNVINVKDNKTVSFKNGFVVEFNIKLNSTQVNSEESLIMKFGSFTYGINSDSIKIGWVKFPTVTIAPVSGSQFNYFPIDSYSTIGTQKLPIGKFVKIRLAYDEFMGALYTSINGIMDSIRYVTPQEISYNNTTNFQFFKGLVNFDVKSVAIYTGKPTINIPKLALYAHNILGNTEALLTFDHIDSTIVPCEVSITMQDPYSSAISLASNIANFELTSTTKLDLRIPLPATTGPNAPSPGLFPLLVNISKDNEPIFSKEVRVLNKNLNSSRTFKINSKNQFTKNGTPFFPLLAYHVKPSDFALVKSFGFNTLFTDFNIINNSGGFQANTRSHLDEAKLQDLNLILSNNIYANNIGKLDLITSGDSSTFMGNYSADEPFGLLSRIIDSYNSLKILDTDSPVFVTMNNFMRLQEAAQGCDVLLVDPYPIPNISIRMVYDAVKRAVAAVSNLKPVWSVIPNYEQKNGTLEQLKCMAWIGIVAGASGVGLFEFDHTTNGVGWKVFDYSAQTANISTVFNEIKSYESLLLSDNHSIQPTSNNLYVNVLKKVSNTLIIVNDSNGPQTATIDSVTYNMNPLEVRIV